MTYLVCLVAFLLKAGYGLEAVGALIGLARLIPVVSNVLIGQYADRFPARTLIVITEFVATLCTLFMLWSWSQGNNYFLLFASIGVLRSCVVAFQMNARAKITKLLSGESYIGNAKNAIRLNRVTQGATFVAGILGYLAIRFLSFEQVILFDGFSFLLGGIVIAILKFDDDRIESRPAQDERFFAKFKLLYRFASRPALLDLGLAVVVAGSTSLLARIAGDNSALIPLLLASYGLAVWCAGSLEQMPWVKNSHASIWFLFAASWVLVFSFPNAPVLTWGFVFVKDLCYWVLFHRYSTHIQKETPAQFMGAVTAARMAQMISILALGELVVGRLSSFMPAMGEGLWRATLCVVVATFVIAKAAPVRDGDARI
jgi:MFS family permease